MRSSHNIKPTRFRSYKFGLALILLLFVVFKPVSNLMLELSEDAIELSEDIQDEEDGERELADEFEHESYWHFVLDETLLHESDNPTSFADQQHLSDFDPEILLPPPRC